MAELIIEHIFEKTDEDGYKCTKEVNDTVNIDFLKSNYKFSMLDDGHILLVPDDDSIFTPIWKYISKDKYRIELKQYMRRGRKSHPVSVTVDVIDKETNESFYLTAYSPDLTEEEYSYFYGRFKKKYPDINWRSLEENMESDIWSYIMDSNPEVFFDDDTAELIAKALIKNKANELRRPGFADIECDITENAAKEAIKEALRLMLEQNTRR